jgi:hypothetical protein
MKPLSDPQQFHVNLHLAAISGDTNRDEKGMQFIPQDGKIGLRRRQLQSTVR